MKRSIDWFIGLWEGEGNISYSNNATVQLVIRMTDEDVMRDVVDTVGGNYTAPPSGNKHNKKVFQWRSATSVYNTDHPTMKLINYLYANTSERRQQQITEKVSQAAEHTTTQNKQRKPRFIAPWLKDSQD